MKKNQFPELNAADYRYNLPEERIAKFPLAQRDQSKLLLYNAGTITDYRFHQLPGLLPALGTLFFNNTKVLPARLFFRKDTGAIIEVFLLSPLLPTKEVSTAMTATSPVQWECTIGNLKRWKDDQPLTTALMLGAGQLLLKASLVNREEKIVQFDWQWEGTVAQELPSFAELISHIGNTPLPPYLNREATEKDRETYQTVYSKNEGAVAAPTAGLHFTPEVMERIRQQGTHMSELTLHVSAGTFKPLTAHNVLDHDMHWEQMVVNRHNIEALQAAKHVTAVGTTSMRTLESLYWYAVKLKEEGWGAAFQIDKLYAYQMAATTLNRAEAAEILLQKLNLEGKEELMGETSMFIMPGYKFRVCDSLITNFHQPESTLVLLVAAFVGEDWRIIYQHALEQGYRFLSYGDSSLLYKNEK